MILHELTANKKSFRPVKFVEGLNVVLAEKASSSGKKDTRNGVGKTTLVEILMFCLGGQATRGKGVIQEALKSWVFTLEVTLKGSRVKISREIADPSKVQIDGVIDGWPIQPDYTELTGSHFYTINRWRDLLGWVLFDLDVAVKSQSDHPVPKGLVSCFIRLGQSAYQKIDSHNLARGDGAEKINMAYLLGLDWEFIGKIKGLRQALREYRATKKVIGEGAFSGAVGNVEEIRVEQSKVLAEISTLEHSLGSYDFSPQYEHLQQEVNALTKETSSLSNRIAICKRRFDIFQDAIREERDVSREDIEKIYRETGLAFPSDIQRTLDEVLEFHRKIVVNRKAFLSDEIERLGAEIERLTTERDAKSKIKGEKTAQLAAQNIYDDLLVQQNRLAELKSIEERQEEWMADLQDLEQKMGKIDAEIEAEKNSAKEDFDERKDVLAPLLDDFASFTNKLYGKEGVLRIYPENDDYSFSVEMERGGSNGVALMGILCFDIALLKAQSRLGREISLLVHDTPILDAVDGRQLALAFELMADESLKMHGQYICTLNSDKVPSGDFTKEFDFNAHVIHRLSDASPADSLLGIHFEVD